MQFQAENIWFRYPGASDEDYALRGVSFTLESAEAVALIGPSGSGKSTLAQILNGLHRPQRGELLADGKVVVHQPATLKALRRQVGLVFQFPEAQIFESSVLDEVAFAARQWGSPEGDIRRLVEAALTAVGLDPAAFLERDPLKLSGGEDRLITIASLLVVDPDWLILDEPSLGLDGVHRRKIADLIRRRIQSSRGVLLITHDLDLAFALCSRVLALQAGGIAFDGSRAALLEDGRLLELGLSAPECVDLYWELRRAVPQRPPPDPCALENWAACLTAAQREIVRTTVQQFIAQGRLIK